MRSRGVLLAAAVVAVLAAVLGVGYVLGRGGGPAASPGPNGRAYLRPLLLLGAHGGAGVSTLAVLLQPAFDVGVVRNWSAFANPQRHPLAVVTGWTVSAAGQAVTQVAAATRAGMPPRVLIVVADGWPQPKAARVRFRLLEAQVGQLVQVPFVRAWRYVDRPDPAATPRPVLRALDEVRTAVYGPVRR